MKRAKPGFIFDIDGTLLDSNDAHAECLQFALKCAGYTFDVPFIRKLIGMGFDQILPKLTGYEAKSTFGDRVAKIKDECFQQKFASLHPFPEVESLFKYLHENEYAFTIASSASKPDLQKSLKKLKIDQWIQSPVSADDIKRSKPAPDAVQAALQHLQLDPDQVFMVGDTVYDIQAAKKAKVRTIALRCGGWADGDLPGAFLILNDPADLLQRLRSYPEDFY